MSTPAERLAERAMDAAERVTDPEIRRICDYIAGQAMYGNREEADIAYLSDTLDRHTRPRGAIQS